MGKARCGGLLFCVPALLLADHDLTPESCICKMLSPHESKGLRTVFAVDGRSQTQLSHYCQQVSEEYEALGSAGVRTNLHGPLQPWV